MQDAQIVALYWERKEQAIRETEEKYGRYLLQIAVNILGDREDGHEVVNDTCWKTWSSIPPQRPTQLKPYLARLARQTAIDRFRSRNRDKRRESQYALSLSELEECVSGGDRTLEDAERHRLAEAMERWLWSRNRQTRCAFLRRYYYGESLEQTAKALDMSQSAVKSLLYRARQLLRAYLEQEGFGL